MTLGGHKDTRQCPEAPTCEAFAGMNSLEEKVGKLASRLFCKSDNYTLFKDGIHRPLTFAFLASQLMYLKEVEKLHPKNQENIIAKAIFAEASDIGINKKDLYEWGSKVHLRFELAKDKAHSLHGVKNLLTESTQAIKRTHLNGEKLVKIDLGVETTQALIRETSEDRDKKFELLTSLVQKQAHQIRILYNGLSGVKQELRSLASGLNTMNTILVGLNMDKKSDLPLETNAIAFSSQTSTQTLTLADRDDSDHVDDDDEEDDKEIQNINDKLMKKAKDKKKEQKKKKEDIDGGRFNNGEPHLMNSATFAARFFIYDKNFVDNEKTFTFPVPRSRKTRLKKVIERINQYLTGEQRKLKPEDIQDEDDHLQVYDMYSSALQKMLPDLYREMKDLGIKYMISTRDKVGSAEVQVGTIASHIEKIIKEKNAIARRATSPTPAPSPTPARPDFSSIRQTKRRRLRK